MTRYCFDIEESSLDEKEKSLLQKIIDSSKPVEEVTTASGEGIDTGSVSETSAGSSPAEPKGEESG